MTVYLIHIDPPLKHAAHYLGYCSSTRLTERLREHAHGQGAKLLKAAVANGSGLYLARTFPDGDPMLEARIKRASHLKLLCPFCCEMLKHHLGETYRIPTDRPEQPPPHPLIEWPEGRKLDQPRMHDNKTPSRHEAAAIAYAQALETMKT